MTHPCTCNAQLEQVRVLLVHLAVNTTGVLLEHETDIARVDGTVDELSCQPSAIAVPAGHLFTPGVGCRATSERYTVSPLRPIHSARART